MAKGHCELVCDISIVGAASCVKYVNAATERLSVTINYLLCCNNKVAVLNLKRNVLFLKFGSYRRRFLHNMACSHCLILGD